METTWHAEHGALSEGWRRLRASRPLILCITNRVTPQRVADTLLAAGASPVMADNPREVAQMAAIAGGVYVNTGLHETQPASLGAASTAISELGKHAVLDPVGAGATAYRTGEVRRLLDDVAFGVVRGNASEIRALGGDGGATRGVDSSDSSDAALSAAVRLSRERRLVTAVSGASDLITDGERVARVGGGHPWLTRITGSGCALGALVTACVAATEDAWTGALTAHAAFALAAERAARHSAGPGTLSIHLLDELAALEPEDFAGAQLTVEQPGAGAVRA